MRLPSITEQDQSSSLAAFGSAGRIGTVIAAISLSSPWERG
jgi:hypothetical protein